MKRLRVDCTTLQALVLTTPPTALELLDAGLTPDWRRQNRSSRFESAFLCISSLKVSAGVATRVMRRFKRRVLSARVDSAIRNTMCFMNLRPLEEDVNSWNLPKCIYPYPRMSESLQVWFFSPCKCLWPWQREHTTEKISNHETMPISVLKKVWFGHIHTAFDSVNHLLLIQKLPHYDIIGKSKLLLESYLINRFQRVQLDSSTLNLKTTSTWNMVKHGDPQGSVLGLS